MRAVSSKSVKIWRVLSLLGLLLGIVIACSSGKEGSKPAGQVPPELHTHDVSWQITFSNPKLHPIKGREAITSPKEGNLELPWPLFLRLLRGYNPQSVGAYRERYPKLLRAIKAKDATRFETAISGMMMDSFELRGGEAQVLNPLLESLHRADCLRFQRYLKERGINASLAGSTISLDVAEAKADIKASLINSTRQASPLSVMVGDTLEALGEIKDFDRYLFAQISSFKSEEQFRKLDGRNSYLFLVSLQRMVRQLERTYLSGEPFDFEKSLRPSDPFALAVIDYTLSQGLGQSWRELQTLLGQISFLLTELSPEIDVEFSIPKRDAKGLPAPLVIRRWGVDLGAFLKTRPKTFNDYTPERR